MEATVVQPGNDIRRRTMKRAVAVAAMAGAMTLGQMTSATAATGAQTFSIVGVNDRQTVIATGLVRGVGTVTPIDDESDLLSFASGTLRLNRPQTGGDFNLNPRTCVATATFTGTYTLTEGAGAYAGASGTGTYSGRGVFRFDRNPDGSCSEADQVFAAFTARNTGTTSLP